MWNCFLKFFTSSGANQVLQESTTVSVVSGVLEIIFQQTVVAKTPMPQFQSKRLLLGEYRAFSKIDLIFICFFNCVYNVGHEKSACSAFSIESCLFRVYN